MGKLYLIPFGENMLEDFLHECQKSGYEYDEVFFLSADKWIDAEDMPFKTGGFKRLIEEIDAAASAISSSVQKIFIGSILLEYAHSGRLKFFAGLEESTAVCEAVCSFINDLEFAGIKPEDFAFSLRENDTFEDKDKELLAIYAAYKALLSQEGLYDDADVHARAAEILKELSPDGFYKKIFVLGFHKFNYLQLEFIKELKKVCDVDISLCYQKEDIYQASRKTYEDIVGLGFDAEFLSRKTKKTDILDKISKSVFRFSEEKLAANDCIKIKRYANKRHEMQEAVADIKSKIIAGARPQDFLLVMRNISLYHGLQREFSIAGVPASIPVTSRLSVFAAADLIIALLDIANNSVRSGLKSLAGNFIMQQCFQIDAGKVLRIIDEKYFSGLEDAKHIFNKTFNSESNEYSMFEWVFAFLRSLPEKAAIVDMNAAMGDVYSKLNVHKVLGGLHKERKLSVDDLKILLLGCEEVINCLEKLSADYIAAREDKRMMSVKRYREILEEIFSKKTVLLSPGRDGGVKVADAAGYAGRGYDHVYVLGLKEGEFPLVEAENWLYDDAKRSQLSSLGFVPSSAEKIDEELFFFMSAICRAKNGLWLSAAVSDNEVLSSYLDEVMVLFDSNICEERAVGAVLPEERFIAGEEVLACFLLDKNITGDWLDGYLGEGFNKRAESELPERKDLYMGILKDSLVMPKVRTFLSGAYTPSSLENYAFCPFKFLLENVWRPDGWEMATDDLRADFKGNFYHECLKLFLQKHKGELLQDKDFTALSSELISIFEEQRAGYDIAGKTVQSILTRQLFAEMKEYLTGWLKKEIYYQEGNKAHFCPYEFEWPFYDLRFEGKTSAAFVKGRIDRIDTDGKDYFITDYKSKGTPDKKAVTEGLDLQMPIYALAVEQSFKAPVGGDYFSVEKAERSGGFWTDEAKEKLHVSSRTKLDKNWDELREAFIATITNITDGIFMGDFPPLPRKECPGYCPGNWLCRLGQRGQDNE